MKTKLQEIILEEIKKLNEIPDLVYFRGNKMTFKNEDALVFGYMDNILLTGYGVTHMDLVFEALSQNRLPKYNQQLKEIIYNLKSNLNFKYKTKEQQKAILDGVFWDFVSDIRHDDMKYDGRIWILHKVMSFWEYPENNIVLHRVLRQVENQTGNKIIDNGFHIEVYDDKNEPYFIPVEEFGAENHIKLQRKPHEIPITKWIEMGGKKPIAHNTQHLQSKMGDIPAKWKFHKDNNIAEQIVVSEIDSLFEDVEMISEGAEEINELSALGKAIAQYLYRGFIVTNNLEDAIISYQIGDILDGKAIEATLSDIVEDTLNLNDFPKTKDFILNSDLLIRFVFTSDKPSALFGSKRLNKELDTNIISVDFGHVIWYKLTHLVLKSMGLDTTKISHSELNRALNLIYNNTSKYNDYKRNLENKFVESDIVAMIIHELQHAYDDYVSKGKFVSDKTSKKFYRLKRILMKYPELKNNPKFMAKYNYITSYDNYVNLHHEVKARMSSALNHVGNIIKKNPHKSPQELFKYDFIPHFQAYDMIRKPTAIKQIQKIFYRYYTHIMENLENKN